VRVLQVHHRQQLAARDVPVVTKGSDLAVVCANCHLLLHLNPEKALSVKELQEMLRVDSATRLPNTYQASVVKWADGCIAGAGWPSEKQIVNPARQAVVADLISVAGHSPGAAPNTY
jgi:hypothetical protein